MDAPETPWPEGGPDERAEASWLTWRVHRAIEQLPEHERPVIELAYWGGLSQSEISAFLDVPLGTVKTPTRSTLSRLSNLLKEEFAISDRFDELVGEIEDPAERERLRRVHTLLLSVDAPPELPAPAESPAPVVVLQRRRRPYAVALVAAAIAAVAFRRRLARRCT